MATRQRLRAVLDARRTSRPCWRCALDQHRYGSTSQVGKPDSSKNNTTVSFDQVLERELHNTSKSHRPRLRPETTAERLEEVSEGESNRKDLEPSAQVAGDDLPVHLATRPQPQLVEAIREPRIRIVSDGQPVRLNLCRRLRSKDQRETAATITKEVVSSTVAPSIRRWRTEDKIVPH